MTQDDQIRADLARFNATGELPAAWTPEPYRCGYCFECEEGQACTVAPSALELARHQSEFDARVDEINRDPEIAAHLAELDAIESGCAEPPVGGWITNIRVSR